MTIETTCMVVNLHVSKWAGLRHDKAASDKVTSDTGADSDVARVNKRLVRKEATAAIDTAANALRAHFYANTMPWKDNGDRILPRNNFMEFSERHGKLMQDYNRAIDDFLNNTYQVEVDRAAFRMGAMYNPAEFPRVEDLRSKFRANLVIDSVTAPGDFRVELSKDAADAVKDAMAEQHQERVSTAMGDLWSRLRERLAHFHEKTASDKNPRLYASMIDNLADIVAMVPKLNFTNDEKLNDLAKEIEQYLLTNNIDDLRKDESARKSAATEAKRIMDDFGGLLNSFGGNK